MQRHGGDFWSDLSNGSKWQNELTNPNSNAINIASKFLGRGNYGSGFYDDLHNPMKWAHEAFSKDSNSRKIAHNVSRLGKGRTGGNWMRNLKNKLVDPNSYLHELTDPSSVSWQALHHLSTMGKGKPRGPSKRGAIVREVMQAHPGMSLPEASRFVKENGLYVK